jgi:glycosyltransferase involved in cell wall biosynthesis
MESAGMEFAQRINSLKKPDLVLATNLMDLPQWKTFSTWGEIPHLLYVHENQLDYPLKDGERRDLHYVWKDYTNYRIADRIVFNSRYNLDSFCRKFGKFRASLPDMKPENPETDFRRKSSIIPPGCTLVDTNGLISQDHKMETPLFLWNHRWEHDKNPEVFFSLLTRLKKESIPFKLAVVGESFKDSPPCFKEAKSQFSKELVHFGFVQDRNEYEQWLKQADFVFTTALQENFGISMVEAMSAGCIPLMPNRLAYPEVLPSDFHDLFLYENEEDLFTKLSHLMKRQDRDAMGIQLSKGMKQYGWEEIIKKFDYLIEEMLD